MTEEDPPNNPNPNPSAESDTANAIALAYGVVSQNTSTNGDNDTDTSTEVVVPIAGSNYPSSSSSCHHSLKDIAVEGKDGAIGASTRSNLEHVCVFHEDDAGFTTALDTPAETVKEVVSDAAMEETEFTDQDLVASSSEFLMSASKDTPLEDSSTMTVTRSEQQQQQHHQQQHQQHQQQQQQQQQHHHQQQLEMNETPNGKSPSRPNSSSIESSDSPKEITPSLMEGANEVVDALITQAETSPLDLNMSQASSQIVHPEPEPSTIPPPPSLPPPPPLNDQSSAHSTTHPQCYYALKRGISTCNCLYLQWQDLVAQTDQYAHAEFKTFTDLNEAIEYLYHNPCVGEPKRNPPLGENGPVEMDVEDEVTIPSASTTHPKRPMLPIHKNLPSQRQTEKWMQNYHSLVQYQQIHQNVNVAASSSLGRWIASQRLTYRKQSQGVITSTVLTKERIQQLTSLGVDLERKRSKKAVGGIACEERWDEFYRMLNDFLNEYGHLTVPTQ